MSTRESSGGVVIIHITKADGAVNGHFEIMEQR
jgi:hypothetical protein